jgi:hypothetical protein
LLAVIVVAATLTGCIGSDDDGGDDDEGVDATLSAPETLAPIPVEPTIPAVSIAGDAIGEVLADDVVTADELTAAYTGYIECLADGGGIGRYAFDVELRTGLAVEWTLVEGDADDGDGGVDRNALDTSCSRRFLGDLTRRFEAANPAPDDLAARQRDSIAACIAEVSPSAAANLPEAISVGTAGEAASLGELQLDPAALDPETLSSDPNDVAAVSDCIASVGSEWRAFG